MSQLIEAESHPVNAPKTNRLLFYFALMYFAQGFSQIVCLVNQPVRAYLKSLNYDAKQVSFVFAIANIPWVIKPFYGLISDFIPLMGYRRKSYLLLMNMVAALGFLWMGGMINPKVLMITAVLVGVGVAAADVIVDALMVEVGQRTGLAPRFQSIQWTSISIAGVLSGVLSAYLLNHYPSPAGALRMAAYISALMPLGVAMITFWAVSEEKSRLNLPELKSSYDGLVSAFKSKELLIVVAFLALLTANPGVVTPLNTYMTDELSLSDSFVALTDAMTCAGNVIGAGIFMWFFSEVKTLRRSMIVGIIANSVSMVPFLFIRGPWTAGIGEVVYGIGYMVGNLALLALAARACPKRAEGFVFAAMMSVLNFSNQGFDYIGSWLYEQEYGFMQIFHHRIFALMVLSIALSLLCLPIMAWIPFLRRSDQTITA